MDSQWTTKNIITSTDIVAPDSIVVNACVPTFSMLTVWDGISFIECSMGFEFSRTWEIFAPRWRSPEKPEKAGRVKLLRLAPECINVCAGGPHLKMEGHVEMTGSKDSIKKVYEKIENLARKNPPGRSNLLRLGDIVEQTRPGVETTLSRCPRSSGRDPNQHA